MPSVSDEASEWGAPSQYRLTELEAYDVMLEFLDTLWKRGNKGPIDLAAVLGFINRNKELNLPPGDIAQWADWLAAIRKTKIL